MLQITQLQEGKKIFFISDLHLPVLIAPTASHREDRVIAWLDYIKPQAAALFLLGDIFDFWFEYKYLIPKSSLRFQAKLLEFHQAAIPLYLFAGNHDYWHIAYLNQACGVQLFRAPLSMDICNHLFFMGHGDRIPFSLFHTLLGKLYRSKGCSCLARMIPADWLYRMVYYFYLRNKDNHRYRRAISKEDPIFQYCKYKIEPYIHHDFYIFGHIHRPSLIPLSEKSYYCNLGDWIRHCTYACFDGVMLSLHSF